MQVVPNENDDSIWIKLKKKFLRRNDDIFIGTFYCSPTSSKNKNANDFFSSFNEEINIFQKKGITLVQGDLNARTGTEKDFINYDKSDDQLGINNTNNLTLLNVTLKMLKSIPVEKNFGYLQIKRCTHSQWE